MPSIIDFSLLTASSTILNISEASILFELPSNFFGHLCSSASSPLFYTESYSRQALEYRTIPMIPLLLAPMMKAYLLEESYLLPEDLFCQPMPYVTVSLTLLLFFPLFDRAHQSTYELLLCYSVCFISS